MNKTELTVFGFMVLLVCVLGTLTAAIAKIWIMCAIDAGATALVVHGLHKLIKK